MQICLANCAMLGRKQKGCSSPAHLRKTTLKFFHILLVDNWYCLIDNWHCLIDNWQLTLLPCQHASMILQYVGNPNLCINYLQDGKTASSIAKKSGHNEIVELLHKAKVCMGFLYKWCVFKPYTRTEIL